MHQLCSQYSAEQGLEMTAQESKAKQYQSILSEQTAWLLPSLALVPLDSRLGFSLFSFRALLFSLHFSLFPLLRMGNGWFSIFLCLSSNQLAGYLPDWFPLNHLVTIPWNPFGSLFLFLPKYLFHLVPLLIESGLILPIHYPPPWATLLTVPFTSLTQRLSWGKPVLSPLMQANSHHSGSRPALAPSVDIFLAAKS